MLVWDVLLAENLDCDDEANASGFVPGGLMKHIRVKWFRRSTSLTTLTLQGKRANCDFLCIRISLVCVDHISAYRLPCFTSGVVDGLRQYLLFR